MCNVLITGVSTGIGEAIAASCIKKGYRVFGSVRNERDAQQCSQKWGNQFTPLIMDLRKSEIIKANFEKVQRELGKEKLHVLVNNSGVAKAAPLELQKIEDIKEMFDVNVFGLIEVTRIFLPLIKFEKKDQSVSSKIINISSGAGQIGIPFLGAYVATKHAVEGLSHAWRRELMPFGIDVVLVGPGNVVTPIWNKAEEQTAFEASPYKPQFKNFFDYMIKEGRKGMKPREIADVVMEIINTNKPKVRYAPVAQKLINWYIPRWVSSRTLDSIFFKNMKMKKLYKEQ